MDTRGNVIIQGLWDRKTDTIIYVKLGDADADTYRFEPMLTLLDWWEKMKTDNHGNHYHKQQKHFLCLLFMLMAC